jgi:hypothetical protein
MQMIKESRSFRLTSSGGSEIQYQVISNNNCVSVTPSNGVAASGTIVNFEFDFSDEACFATNFTIRAKSQDCPDFEEFTFVVPVPCTTLLGVISNTPSSTNPFIFNLALQGGTPSYQVQWQFNTALFETVTVPTNDRLELRIKSGVSSLPNTAEIRAFVLDSKGCQRTTAYILTLCSPIVFDGTVQTSCINTINVDGLSATSAFGGYQLQSSSCAGSSIDWETTEFNFNPSRLRVQRNGSQLVIYARGNSFHTSQEQLLVRVQDTTGVYSAWATINVTIPPCTEDIDIVLDTQ